MATSTFERRIVISTDEAQQKLKKFLESDIPARKLSKSSFLVRRENGVKSFWHDTCPTPNANGRIEGRQNHVGLYSVFCERDPDISQKQSDSSWPDENFIGVVKAIRAV